MTRTPSTTARIDRGSFGATPDGREAELFTLSNGRGLEAQITNYGGIVVSMLQADRHGRYRDVVLGHDSAAAYGDNRPFLGALVGRYANRIAVGRFELDGQVHRLAQNDGAHHLHGGPHGFHQALWRATPTQDPEGPSLELRHRSPDGEGGYPGNLDVTVVYTLTGAGELWIRYRASSDRATPINLTNHAYFNLGDGPDILDHEARLNASRFVPSDTDLIPTGEVRPVDGTPLDFRAPARIRDRLDTADPLIVRARGIDHCFVIDRQPGEELAVAAEVYDRASGRALQVRTTEPAIQFYTGNFLDGSVVGRDGRRYVYRSGFCLEAQHYPDSPNRSQFPSTILRPGAEYRQTTIYRFACL